MPDPREQPPGNPPQFRQYGQQQQPYQQPQQPQQQPDPWGDGGARNGGYGQPPGPQYPPPAPQWQQQPYRPPYAPPPRRRHKGLKIFAAVCGGIFVLGVVIAAVSPSTPATAPSATATAGQPTAAAPVAAKAPAAQTVTYVVTGSAASVTYGPAGSDYSGSVPMHVSKPLGSPIYYSVSAQLQGGGTVSCKIEVNGKAVSSSTASGDYNIAQCEISQDPLSGQWTDTNG